MNETDLFRQLLARFHEECVEYILIDGQAVRLNGFLRTTEDVDVLIRASRENGERVKRALSFLCAVKVHFTSGCKSRPRNCRCTSVAIGRGHGLKATVVLEAPRQKASERGLSKHAGRNASEA